MNRALANLNIHSYDEALNDLRWLMVQDHPPEKAIYRNAQALYHLGHFQLCRATLTKLLRDYPKNENALREKARVEQRLAERKSGIYDFRKMYCASRAKSLDLDHSSYFGPVMVKVSRGRGFGLFTTDHVKAGDLLLCEKAFSYSHKENAVRSKDSSGTPVLANMLTNRIMIGTQVSLMKETIQKLKLNPSLLSTVTSLHHGTYVPSKETDDEVDDEVIDTYVSRQVLMSISCCWHVLMHRPLCLCRYCYCSHYTTASAVGVFHCYSQVAVIPFQYSPAYELSTSHKS